MQKLLSYWEQLRSSLWFVPAILVVVAVGAAQGALTLDRTLADLGVEEIAWAFSGGPEAARVVLGTIAGSMITIAGVTFSITIVALVLASQQFAPRVLRNFMRDTFNQTVLGLFVATFLYALLILGSIRSGETAYVPPVAVAAGLAFAVVSLGFYIYFIHHIATSIRVDVVLRDIAEATSAAVDKEYPRGTGEARAAVGDAADPPADGWPVRSLRSGYVERINLEELARRSGEAGLVAHLLVAPGDFAVRGAPLALTDQAPGDLDSFTAGFGEAFVFSITRSLVQDPSFGFRQLVDVALKALSPGINDPTTASSAVSYLEALLVDLADRPWPPAVLTDGEGEARLHLKQRSFGDYVELATAEIRRYAASDLQVTLRLVAMLTQVAAATREPARRQALRRQAELIAEGAGEGIRISGDRRRVEAALARLATALGA